MARCSEQVFEVTQLIEDRIDEVIGLLSNKSFKEAVNLAQGINNSQFFGNKVITVNSNFDSREDGTPEISFNKEAKEKTINDKVQRDNQIEMDQRIAELKSGNNFEFPDDFPVSTPTYNEYSYENVLSNKMLLKENIDRHRDLLKNKKSTKENLEQLEELNELSRKLYIDITNLQKQETVLDNYLESIYKDIKNVETLLKNPTFDNIQIINDYIEILEKLTSTGKESFLGSIVKDNEETGEVNTSYLSLSTLENLDKKAHEKLSTLHKDISLLKNKADTEIINTTIKLIEYHLKQKEEFKNAQEIEIRKEAERLYDNQIKPEIDKNILSSSIGKLDKYITSIDSLSEEDNVLGNLLFKTVSDSLSKSNTQDTREKLFNVKDKVFRELKRQGKIVGKGFNKKPDQNIFLREDKFSHQLIGKFSSEWVNFKKNQNFIQNKISKILYKGDKNQNEIKEIQKQFDNLKEEVTFIDSTRIPEIIDTEEFSTYSLSFKSLIEAEQYKKELIDKIGEREYNKIVKEQKEKIYSYEVFKNLKEARLRDKYSLNENQDLQNNIPEKEWNKHLHFLYSKSPFIFSENYRNKGSNIITKPYYVQGEKFLSENTPADLEFISYVPKKEKYFDEKFKELESNEVFKEAWSYMADLVEYNNNNGFNHNPDNLSEYSIASQTKKVKHFPLRLLGLFSKNLLKTVHKGLVTSSYRQSTQTISENIKNVDQKIEELYNILIKKHLHPTASTQKEVREKAKALILDKEDFNLIDNILNTSEIVETFKAKREMASKVEFIKNRIKDTGRKRFFDITQDFIDSKLYGIDNRANWNLLKKSDKSISGIPGFKWTKFYDENKAELNAHAKEIKKTLEESIKNTQDNETKNKLKKEIIAIDKFIDSGGKVLTTGSLIEGAAIKSIRYVAFSVNVAAQVTNIVMGDQNAQEVDGKLGFWDAGDYQDALSFSKKIKQPFRNKEEKKEVEVGELLLRRYKIFQNSANEAFKIEQSRTGSAFNAVLENPINFVSEVEKTIQRPQIFALMTQIKIKSGDKEVPMFDPKTKTFPAFNKNEKGNLVLKEEFNTKENRETFIENTSQEYANLFGDAGRIPKAIAYINGDYRDLSRYLYESTTGGALLFLFKRWSIETYKKNFGVLNRLSDNEHGGLGASTLLAKGALFSFAGGAVLGPFGYAIGLGAYGLTRGYLNNKNLLAHDVNQIKESFTNLLNLKATPIQGVFKRNIYLSMAVSAQTLGMIINPLTGKAYINSDHVKKLIKLKDKKSDGEEFSPKEIREIKEDIYFLTTSIANTLKFLALRYLVMMFLYPDEEEEKKHKKRVKEGDKFWSRLYQDPDTAAYYILENTLSGMINDSNFLVNLDGIVRAGDAFGLKKLGVLSGSLEDWVLGKGEYKAGVNEGKNKFLTNFLRYYTPSSLKDGVSLGFGSKSKKDYNAKNYIDQIKIPLLEKVNDARLIAREKKKKELEASGDYDHLEDDKKTKKIDKKLLKLFPVIKEKDLDEEGKLKDHLEYKWESYWKE